uniref:Uncharacterized protein n=1 Tax=Schistosoma curassoni TaxID=6186 RepID=A0A183L3W0_9TREM
MIQQYNLLLVKPYTILPRYNKRRNFKDHACIRRSDEDWSEFFVNRIP